MREGFGEGERFVEGEVLVERATGKRQTISLINSGQTNS